MRTDEIYIVKKDIQEYDVVNKIGTGISSANSKIIVSGLNVKSESMVFCRFKIDKPIDISLFSKNNLELSIENKKNGFKKSKSKTWEGYFNTFVDEDDDGNEDYVEKWGRESPNVPAGEYITAFKYPEIVGVNPKDLIFTVKIISGGQVTTASTSTLQNDINAPIDGFDIRINDIPLNYGEHYTVASGVVNFANKLSQGDKITIKDSILNSVKIVTKSSYDRNSLYKMYSDQVKFRFNHNYKMIVNITDISHEMSFMTKYDPFYATVDKIRLDTGNMLEHTSDEQIAKVIYSNSKDALQLLGENVDTIPKYAKNYVRYKTDIDLCYALYLSMTGKVGSYSKRIGDIAIESSTKLPFLKDMIGRFKELLKPNEDLMNSEEVGVLSFVKANKTQYPVSNRGVF